MQKGLTFYLTQRKNYRFLRLLFNNYNFVRDKPMNRKTEMLEERGIKQMWLAKKLEKIFYIINSYICKRIHSSLNILFQKANVFQI